MSLLDKIMVLIFIIIIIVGIAYYVYTEFLPIDTTSIFEEKPPPPPEEAETEGEQPPAFPE